MATQKTTTGINLAEFTSKLKKEDKGVKILFQILTTGAFIALGILIYSTDFDATSTAYWIKKGCLFLAVIGYIPLAYREYKRFKTIDYSLSTFQMLKKMVKRYRFLDEEDKLSIIPLGLFLFGYLWHSEISSLNLFLYFIGFIILAFAIAYGIWFIRHKPLQDRAKSILKNLEE